MAQTVTILYGFSEGSWQGNRLRAALFQRGYKVISDSQKADIIIAHSAGCYYVPQQLEPTQQVVMINPTYWPERPLKKRAFAMVLQILRAIRPGNDPLFQVRKTLYNLYYLVRHACKNWSIIQRARTFELPTEIHHPRTLLIRNKFDPWLTPNMHDLTRLNPHLHIVELPGEHDNCWQDPEPYIDLLQSFHKEW